MVALVTLLKPFLLLSLLISLSPFAPDLILASATSKYTSAALSIGIFILLSKPPSGLQLTFFLKKYPVLVRPAGTACGPPFDAPGSIISPTFPIVYVSLSSLASNSSARSLIGSVNPHPPHGRGPA